MASEGFEPASPKIELNDLTLSHYLIRDLYTCVAFFIQIVAASFFFLIYN
jgi:hypothetical protein